MLEFPEAINIAKQLRAAVTGRTICSVLPPAKAHKFCWFNGDPDDYSPQLSGAKLLSAEGFGIFAELELDNGKKLCFNDGVNVRLVNETPKNYQLAILLDDGSVLAFSVAMYGGIILHDGSYDNNYYIRSREFLPYFSSEFDEYFHRLLSESKPNLSAKAFLATEQRFPGIGNGVLQDILFEARIHPKRKLSSLDNSDKALLLESVNRVLREMTERGGRDTEKDLFGNVGGYKTKMSKNSCGAGCPVCHGEITKEAYLGGSVYYCSSCQPLK